MGYKKVIIAIDCDNEEEQRQVQAIAQDISQSFRLKAKDLIGFYPTLQQHKGLLYTAITTISREGKKGIIRLVPMLLKQL